MNIPMNAPSATPSANTNEANTIKEALAGVKATPLTNGSGVVEACVKAGEKLGEFRAYSSQLPIADISGTRIIKCLYQVNPKTKERSHDNVYVRVQTKHLTETSILSNIDKLLPHFLTYLQTIEDNEIKALHKKGALKVYDEYLSVDKIITALEVTSNIGRLNKESIEAWFKEYVEAGLTALVNTKLGVDDESSVELIEKAILVIEAYKARFASLASPKKLNEADCEALINVIAKAGGAGETSLGMRLIKKLETKEEKVDLLDL